MQVKLLEKGGVLALPVLVNGVSSYLFLAPDVARRLGVIWTVWLPYTGVGVAACHLADWSGKQLPG